MSSTANSREIVVGVRANPEILARFETHGAGLQDVLIDEMSQLAQETAAMERQLAPKWHSILVNSIHVQRDGLTQWSVRPGAQHGLYQEQGRKPGKGLPRFFDPAAKGIVDWLQSKAFAGTKRPRKGTKRFTARELELRDRYMGLSRHAKFKGLKATPFVEPTFNAMEPIVQQRCAAAAQRFLAKAEGGA